MAEPGPDGWSGAHHGIDPETVPFVRGWLRLVDVACRPLVALRVPPDAITGVGLALSLLVPVLAATGRLGWAVGAVLLSVLLDGLDGAVALRTNRVSTYGRTLDSTCDRLSELAWWVALAVGAAVPWWAVAVLTVLTLGSEGWRERTGRLGVITVWERPTRTILVVVGLAFAGLGLGRVTGTVGVALAVAGTVQLGLAVRRQGS